MSYPACDEEHERLEVICAFVFDFVFPGPWCSFGEVASVSVSPVSSSTVCVQLVQNTTVLGRFVAKVGSSSGLFTPSVAQLPEYRPVRYCVAVDSPDVDDDLLFSILPVLG